MALSLYNEKRNFKKTSEPSGKKKSTKGALKFVVQKHDASHLHYDFRLEMEGVLKSWAIPKGPSLNPSDKRLAMAVEDHPFDYKDFEGTIPEGEYGGGTVIVWDEGTYEPMNAEGLSRKEQEKLLLAQLEKGDLKLSMNGEKLKGNFALFRMKGRGEKTWLLVKKDDEYATDEDIRQQEASVKTGKTLYDVAEENGTVVKHPEDPPLKTKKSKAVYSKKAAAAPSKAKSKTASKKKLNDPPAGIEDLISKGSKSSMPDNVVPMMATLVDHPFDDNNWLFEVKWDGYRAVSYCNGNKVNIKSRNLKSFSSTYTSVTEALKELGLNAVLDGEILAMNENGYPEFQLMQNYQNTPVPLQYYVFDLLWLNGYDLTSLPLIERKEILASILPKDNDVIKYSDHIVGSGNDFFQIAMDKGLEGIMGKRADSTYSIGKRSDRWLKIKVSKRQEVVIGGFTKPRNTREYFGAILLGVYDKGNLVYVGHSGSGFNAQSLKEVYGKLQKLVTTKCPFKTVPKTNQPATWVKPELVCEIKLSEWTKEGIARHPIFMGLRTDKKPTDVVLEKEKHLSSETINDSASAIDESTPKSRNKNNGSSSVKKKGKAAKNGMKTSGQQIDLSEGKDQVITIDSNELKLTNLDKPYWKKEKFTKGDMVNYYMKVAPFMLPYMMDRPQSLNRHPNGIAGSSFYQKDVEGKVADWIKTFPIYSESNNETIEYLVCNNESTLIYMANLGCIEMNPWHSRYQNYENPDWCLIDLDPDTPNTFEQVIEVANVVKGVLDSIGAESYPKTSGSTGIHIYIPLGAKYSYEQSKQLAELIVHLVHHEMLSITSLERSPSKRKGKIYLDYLQNRLAQTAAAPYSLRPKPGVPVSTPLDWSEVKKGLTPTTYTAFNLFDRLKTEGDLFNGVLGKGIDMKKVLEKLQALFA